MKISLKLANGATLEFDGDATEFERVSDFLTDPPDSLVAEPSPGSTLSPPPTGGSTPEAEEPEVRLDPATVAAQLEAVGARNDQERVTVMTQLAMDSGREGIDFATVSELYTDLGFPKPAQFPSKTFANAKGSGLVRLVTRGLWRTTHIGENFAHGHGRAADRSTRRVRKKASGKRGGEPD
jgi:hypothetical protein